MNMLVSPMASDGTPSNSMEFDDFHDERIRLN